ncbi:hypothetical protein BC829DRAFT_418391 [Chytridium lagenaria]|nr:hypothetical protein BC829DRAFT_418391 [Chytridium lagenaria]
MQLKPIQQYPLSHQAALASKSHLHANLSNPRQTPTTEGLTTWRTIPGSISTPVHWIITEDHAGNLSPTTIAKLQFQNRDLSHTETADLPTLLPLQEGHQYIITNNLAPELNISKSSKCTLVKISYPSCYHPPTDRTGNIYPDRLPELLEAKHTHYQSPANNFAWYQRMPSLSTAVKVNDGQACNYSTTAKKQRLSFNEVMPSCQGEETLHPVLDVKPSADTIAETHRIQTIANRTKTEIWKQFPISLHNFYTKMME